LERNKLGVVTVKRFSTAAEDRGRIDLRGWKVHAPAANTSGVLSVVLGKSLDYRGLLSGLTVKTADGQPVDGECAIGADERSWCFTPSRPWRAGRHCLHVSPELEDVAGNTPARPFDLDLSSLGETAQSLRIDFETR